MEQKGAVDNGFQMDNSFLLNQQKKEAFLNKNDRDNYLSDIPQRPPLRKPPRLPVISRLFMRDAEYSDMGKLLLDEGPLEQESFYSSVGQVKKEFLQEKDTETLKSTYTCSGGIPSQDNVQKLDSTKYREYGIENPFIHNVKIKTEFIDTDYEEAMPELIKSLTVSELKKEFQAYIEKEDINNEKQDGLQNACNIDIIKGMEAVHEGEESKISCNIFHKTLGSKSRTMCSPVRSAEWHNKEHKKSSTCINTKECAAVKSEEFEVRGSDFGEANVNSFTLQKNSFEIIGCTYEKDKVYLNKVTHNRPKAEFSCLLCGNENGENSGGRVDDVQSGKSSIEGKETLNATATEVTVKKEVVDTKDKSGMNECNKTNKNLENAVNSELCLKHRTSDRPELLKSQTSSLKKYLTQVLGNNEDSSGLIKREQKNSRIGVLQKHWLYYRGQDLKAKLVIQFGHHGKGIFSGMHFPIGITVNTRGQIIVCDTGNHVVKIFSSTGTFLWSIGVDPSFPSMHRPSAVVVNENDDIFVKDDICIQVFNRHGVHLRLIGHHLFHNPYGLEMMHDGTLVVLDTYPKDPRLYFISQFGVLLRCYPFHPLLYCPPFSKCRFLAISDDNIIISDLGRSEIYVTTVDGRLRHTIGQKGHGPGEFFEPSGVVADGHGNLIIADSKNNRLHAWRQDGTFAGFIAVDEPVIRPSGMHLTKDDKLYVVNYLHHKIQVFQLQHYS
ncbi:hypothetical protein CHS0354_004453 [Potamilus streckersoni]|uniref:Uncharacterized protein n=1 Tax=Potamilus streckersoni TaxID=2493646 RepID=A0AAE0VZ94_9BIVA|nr:hypothetical protein CHS0354_004453 [Potamilus streckersoni]